MHISLEERPRERMRALRLAVATASVRRDTGPPMGSCRSNSFSSSWTALSATGFLFWFLACPKTMVIL